MRRIASIFILAGLLIGNVASAQFVKNVSKVGTTAAPFLEIGIGARAISMGGAFVAVSNDATALYWNPAGISTMQFNEVVFNQTQWLAGISHSYVGGVIKMGHSNAIGASITSVSMGEMDVRTVEQPEGTGERFGSGMLSIALTGSRNLTDMVSIGFTGKYIQESIWHMKASAMALDVGTLFRTNWHGLTLGMSITNFGNKMHLTGRDTQVKHDIDPTHAGNNSKINGHLDTDSWSLPLNFQVGVSMNLINAGWNRVTVAMDAMHPNNNTESVNLGMEYALNDLIFIRGGYKALFQSDTEEGLTLGGGIHYNVGGQFILMADYAYADFGILNNVQRFTFSLKF